MGSQNGCPYFLKLITFGVNFIIKIVLFFLKKPLKNLVLKKIAFFPQLLSETFSTVDTYFSFLSNSAKLSV